MQEQDHAGFEKLTVPEVAPFGVKEEEVVGAGEREPVPHQQTIPEIEEELAREAQEDEAVVAEIVDPPPPAPTTR